MDDDDDDDDDDCEEADSVDCACDCGCDGGDDERRQHEGLLTFEALRRGRGRGRIITVLEKNVVEGAGIILLDGLCFLSPLDAGWLVTAAFPPHPVAAKWR